MAYPTFSSGDVLNASDMNAVGLWRVTSGITATNGTVTDGVVTINSGVASCTVSGCFSSTYKHYRIVVSGVDCSANGAGAYFTLSGSTGSTYYMAGIYMAYSASTVNGTNKNGTADGGLWSVTGTERNDAIIDIFSPNVSSRTTWVVNWSNDLYPGTSQGYDSNSTSHTGFVLKAPSALTITGGEIRVYGYRD